MYTRGSYNDYSPTALLVKKAGIDLEDAYQELEMEDPFVDTHENPGSENEIVQLHSHNYYEILYICSGNIQYLIRTERYRIQKGDIIIVPPGGSHQLILQDDRKEPYKRYVLWLSTDFIKGIAPLFPDTDFISPKLLRTAGTRWATISNKFYSGIMESERKLDGWKAAIYGNTLELITMLYRASLDKEAYPQGNSKTSNVHKKVARISLATFIYLISLYVKCLFVFTYLFDTAILNQVGFSPDCFQSILT